MKKIPKEIKFPSKTNKSYTLTGVIHYDAPIYGRKVTENLTGHFITYSRRPTGQWFMIDDSRKKAAKKTEYERVMPSIILYRKK